MYGCTAPVYGHRSSAAAARCPACGGRSRYRPSAYYPPLRAPYEGTRGSASGGSSSSRGASPTRRTRTGATVSYSSAEWRSLAPVARKAEEQAKIHPQRRDLFLCHAWEDREDAAA